MLIPNYQCRTILSLHLYQYMNRFPQKLRILENENGHGKVTKHEKLAEYVMEFCHQSCNFHNSALEFYPQKIMAFSHDDIHGKLRNSHGFLFCKAYGNPDEVRNCLLLQLSHNGN